MYQMRAVKLVYKHSLFLASNYLLGSVFLQENVRLKRICV